MKFAKKTEYKCKTTNLYGAPAYKLGALERLVNIGSTLMFGESKYYGDVKDLFDETINEVAKKEPEFLLKYAAYLRQELNLRTTPVYILVKSANINECKSFVRKWTPHIIQRADEIIEVMTCQLEHFGRTVPNSLKKGIADSFKNFDEYQYAKYNRKTTVTFRDVLRIVHAKEPSDIIGKIIEGKLKTPETWEVKMSKDGKTDKSKKESWDEIIKSKKMGYMAILRNLRNFVEQDITEVDTVVNYITNEKAIEKSKQLPFRFLSAYEVLDKFKVKGHFESEKGGKQEIITKFKGAVNTALEKSVDLNVSRLPGKTVIVCDNSGSMEGDCYGSSKVSYHSIRTMADIANLLGVLAWYASDDTFFTVFGTTERYPQLSRQNTVLENLEIVKIAGRYVGYSTEFRTLRKMISEKVFADRLIVLSDLQIGVANSCDYNITEKGIQEQLIEYRKKVNPNFKFYSVCVNGYGTDIILGEQKALMNGWSEKILDFISAYEKDKTTQVKHIQEFVPRGDRDKKRLPNKQRAKDSADENG